MKENLGKLAKDKITGFTGVIVGYCVYLTGCNQYSLLPKSLKSDGSPMDNHWFDCKRIDIIQEEGIPVESVKDTENPGCDILPPR